MLLQCPCRFPKIILNAYNHFWPKLLSKILCRPHDQHAVTVLGSCDVSTGYRLAIFQNLSPCNFFWRQTGQNLTETLWRSYGNRTVIMQSLCNVHDLCIEIMQCTCNVLAGSLRISQMPTIIKLLSKILCCPHYQCALPVRESCNVSMGYRLAIFQNFS